jgi:gamma-D-glutamyl-L-lysine dipeptidyl-peptidase
MKEYVYCRVSISPLRSEAKDGAEMVSQLLFGEVAEILEIQNQWRKVQCTTDGYEGWMDEKLLTTFTEEQMIQWTSERTVLFNSLLRIQTNMGPMNLTRGAYISSSTNSSFRIGKEDYTLLSVPEASLKNVGELALSYLNSPYLWGGKTLFGIDCSGFTQMIYRFFHVELPRDAAQQVEKGTEISYDKMIEGDLAFFKNAAGKVHHVGIVLSGNKIIHAHGQVRVDLLTETGIFNTDKESYSHSLHCIKRHF